MRRLHALTAVLILVCGLFVAMRWSGLGAKPAARAPVEASMWHENGQIPSGDRSHDALLGARLPLPVPARGRHPMLVVMIGACVT